MIAFVLFSPILPAWDRVCGMLALSYRTTGRRDVMFRADEDAGYREFIHDLYPTHSRKRIERKCDDLAPYPRAVRVVTAEGDPEKRYGVKDQIREAFHPEVDRKLFATIHSSDTDEEARLFWAMTHPMNLFHARRRARLSKEFLAKTALAKAELERCGIPVMEVCVAGGSVLEACGIRQSNDIDLILPACHREKAAFCKGVDVVGEGYVASRSDEAIVSDPSNHFYVDGLKFAALDIVAEHKSNTTRRKQDKRDMELIRAHGTG